MNGKKRIFIVLSKELKRNREINMYYSMMREGDNDEEITNLNG